MVVACGPLPPAEPSALTVATGDLTGVEVRSVAVDGEPLLVAWVDTAADRARGLKDVTDLGDLAGMLFDLETERVVDFVMRDTLIPLDVAFFAADGSGRGVLSMTPCEEEPCPRYTVGVPVRYALEVPVGSVELRDDSVLAPVPADG